MQLIGEAFGWSHISMLPVMSRDVLGVGAQGLGYLMAASHVGFLIGNLGLSTMGDLKHKSRTAVIGYGGFGLLLALFAGSRSFPLSLALIGAAYAMESLYEANLHTMVQTAVPDRMRGRIISFQALTWGVTGFSRLLYRRRSPAVRRPRGHSHRRRGRIRQRGPPGAKPGALPPAAGVATASQSVHADAAALGPIPWCRCRQT